MMRPRRLSSLGWLCAALALTFAADADAQEATRARLLSDLDVTTFSDHFPPVALARGVSGRVSLSCAVQTDGSSECSAIEETPQGMGFGAAAEDLARDWQFSPSLVNGEPVASTARIALEFQNVNEDAQVIEEQIRVDGTIGVTPEMNTTDQNAAWYPAQAHASGMAGRVLVACAIRSGGARDCAIEGEAPEGLGFAERALALVSDVLARRADLAAGTVVRVPVDFAMHAPGEPSRRMHWEALRDRGHPNYNRYYPQEALARGRNGQALLSCLIEPTGTLACTVVAETPSGFGFAQAALAWARDYRVSAESLGLPGLAIGDRFLMPMDFSVQGGY